MIDTSETLLASLRADNAHEAWERFFRLYWRPIIRYGRKLGLDQGRAEDMLQETMLTLMRVLPTFVYDRDKGRFRNFLLTIVHNKSLATLRRARRERSETVSETLPDPIDSSQLAADALQRWHESLLEEGMHELEADAGIDARTLAVFRAYAVERRPVAEVAKEFGISENAVYQIKNRLTRRLKVIVHRLARNSGTD